MGQKKTEQHFASSELSLYSTMYWSISNTVNLSWLGVECNMN